MTQNEIDIIKNEIASRLPYGVKVNVTNSTVYKDPMTVLGIDYSKEIVKVGENIDGMFFTHNEHAADVKPYLRPMESMTKEEFREYNQNETCVLYKEGVLDGQTITSGESVDWLNAHHFDFRGLIPMGLALPALDGMYKISDTTRTV